MKKSNRSLLATVSFISGLALAASCTVDTSGLTFDDDEYARVSGGDGDNGGDGDGDGDTGGMSGDGDGDGDTGGMTGDGDGDASGGMGGSGSGGTGETGPSPGDLQCSGKRIQVFAGLDGDGEEIWANVGDPCEFICVDGACTGTCEPGSTQCIGSVDSQYCDGDATWQDAPSCTYACDASTGECAGECVPGAKHCDGNQKQVCDGGTWTDDGTVCPNGCTDNADQTQAACTGGCSTGETQCSGTKQRQTCTGGVWVNDATQCPNVCLNGTCGGQCDPYATPLPTQCNPNNSNQAQSCTAPGGVWGQPFDCPFTCVAATGACGGECRPGERSCINGKASSCNGNGVWKTDQDCASQGFGCFMVDGTSGDRISVCGECAPGTATNEVKRCHTDQLSTFTEKCEFDGSRTSWQRDETCPAKGKCWQGKCYGLTVPICGVANPSSGCSKWEEQWTCSPGNNLPEITQCDGGIAGGHCEFMTCESGVGPTGE